MKRVVKAGYTGVWRGERTWNGVASWRGAGTGLTARCGLRADPQGPAGALHRAASNGFRLARSMRRSGIIRARPKLITSLPGFERLHRQATHLCVKSGAQRWSWPDDFQWSRRPALDIYPTTSWDEDALVHPDSRAAFRRLVGRSWTDSLRKMHPDERIYTFWHYMRNRWERNDGLRLDHLLLSANLADRLEDAGVDREERGREGASDHAPSWIRLDLEG